MYAKVMASDSEEFFSKFLKFEAFLHTAVHLKKAMALCQDLCETLTDLVASEGRNWLYAILMEFVENLTKIEYKDFEIKNHYF